MVERSCKQARGKMKERGSFPSSLNCCVLLAKSEPAVLWQRSRCSSCAGSGLEGEKWLSKAEGWSIHIFAYLHPLPRGGSLPEGVSRKHLWWCRAWLSVWLRSGYLSSSMLSVGLTLPSREFTASLVSILLPRKPPAAETISPGLALALFRSKYAK